MTLVELLVALVIASIAGAALMQAMLAQSRSSDNNEAWRVARAASRGSLNRLTADLRSAEAEGALMAAAADGRSITVRSPFALGIACLSGTVSVLPVDDSRWDAIVPAGFGGFAWRNSSDAYTYKDGATISTPGTASNCVPPSPASPIHTITAAEEGTTPGRLVNMAWGGGGTPALGTTVLLYQVIRYRFAPSSVLGGKNGLLRSVRNSGGTWSADEVVAGPFDSTSSRFRFFTNSMTPSATPPGALSTVRGLEVQLDGMSEIVPRGASGEKEFPIRTSIFFKNRRD